MTPEDKDFMDRAMAAERRLTDEMFRQRDRAIELLASKAPLMVAVAGFLLALLAYLKAAR